MDHTDLQIIHQLTRNARINASAIGELVNMSVSAVIERIRKMEKAGVIIQYTVLLDNHKMGKGTSAMTFVKLDQQRAAGGFVRSISLVPQIVECYHITGEYGFIIKVVAGSIDEISAVLNDVSQIPGVMDTKTNVVLSTQKNCVSAVSAV